MEKFKEKITGDIILAAIIVVLGIVWTINGVRIGAWERITPGSGFLLLFVGIPIILLCGGVIVNRFLKPRAEEKMSRKDIKIILITLAVTTVGSLLMNELIGTMVSLTFFNLAWYKFYAKLSWMKSIIFTVCIMVSIYAVFVGWLNVRFPTFLDLRII